MIWSKTDRISEKQDDSFGIVFINLGSLLAQIVQIAGFPTLLALALSRFGYPSWVIGAILASQWLVVLLLAPFVPKLMTRFGVRLAAQLGSALSVVAVLLLLIPNSAIVSGLSAIMMGAGLTVRWVVCDTWIVQSVHEKARGRAIGIHETLMGLGLAVGPFITMLSNGNETAAVAIYSAILIASIVCFFRGSIVPEGDIDEASGISGQIKQVFWILPLALLAALAAGYVETSMVSLMPLYLLNFEYPETNALTLLSIFGLGGTILQAPLGWIADRWSFRAAQLLCVALIIIGGTSIITLINLPWAIAVILFVWGGCVGGLNTLAVIEAGSTLRPELSGTGMAMIASSYTLGGVIGPVVSGATLSHGNGHGPIIVIVGLMVAYSLTLTLSRRKRFCEPPQSAAPL
ncbi:MFS transporter [Aureimonas pseudogalii]|uniref:MFS family permease n=1 Tax=Aureimonas pseudogalii TaxID=1744844 RepID=A0A7W6H7W1_9HYPH|nr:MFS transporter [Aureimonas pseudogalii]MBB4000254.1 MFS family permease [Aureimonas pseudogalii]